MRITSVSTSRERARSNGGARRGFNARRLFAATALQSVRGPAARPRAESCIGVVRSRRDANRNEVALAHGGASSAQVATIGRTPTCRARHAPVPSFVRPVWAHRPAGLVSGGGAERQRLQIAAVGRVTIAPLGGFIESSGVLRTPGLAKAHFSTGHISVGSRRTAAPLTGSPVQGWATGTATRRLVGRSNVRGVAHVWPGHSLIRTAVQHRIAAVERRASTIGHARTWPCTNQRAAQYWRRARSNARERHSRLNANR